jgi:hypothetical protein
MAILAICSPAGKIGQKKRGGRGASEIGICQQALRDCLFFEPSQARYQLAVILRSRKQYNGAEGQEMISFRLAVSAVLAAGAVAGCIAYLVIPPARVDDQQPPSTVPNLTGPGTRASTSPDRTPTAEVQAAEAYQQAAEAILKRSPNARAFAGANEQPITGRIPLPKRRPIAAP